MARAVVRVVSLGSDSARVNEVAKLCRAVVHGMEGGRAPKVLLLALARADVGLLSDRGCRRQELQRWLFSDGGPDLGFAIEDGLFITVCDGLDQAFKGIWWMPWH